MVCEFVSSQDLLKDIWRTDLFTRAMSFVQKYYEPRCVAQWYYISMEWTKTQYNEFTLFHCMIFTWRHSVTDAVSELNEKEKKKRFFIV